MEENLGYNLLQDSTAIWKTPHAFGGSNAREF